MNGMRGRGGRKCSRGIVSKAEMTPRIPKRFCVSGTTVGRPRLWSRKEVDFEDLEG
jgi:hypothetical protein